MRDYYIGMDLGGTNIKAALYDKDFSCVAECRTPTESQKGSDVVLHRMADHVYGLLDGAGITKKDIRCMGIGVPGLLDVSTGISIFSPNFLGWENVPVAEYMNREFGIPVYIDNDVRVNLYGEWFYGAGKGKKNVVLLTLGTGLGSGVVIDGHVLYGATGSVGEIGHMNMYREGRPCRCGSSGCLGRYVSARGMLKTVKEKLENYKESILLDWAENDADRITAKMVSEAFDKGDKAAVEVMEETGEILGFGLVNVINLYNPEIIIIGGGMSAAGERLLSGARKIIKGHALELSRNSCEVVTAALGDRAGMLGAAIYAAKK